MLVVGRAYDGHSEDTNSSPAGYRIGMVVIPPTPQPCCC